MLAQIWLGMLILGVLALGLSFWWAASVRTPSTRLGIALLLALLVTGAAVVAWRRERRGYAGGMLSGYLLLTIISAGSDTFWVPDSPIPSGMDGISPGALAGLIYGFGLLLVLIVLVLAATVERIAARVHG
jgi:hypothetical protein